MQSWYHLLKMKTEYTPEDVRQFLQATEHADPDSIEQLAEGHISQAFGFETLDGDKFVLRIAAHQNDFQADKYAGDTFGKSLFVPKVTEIGTFGNNAFYCISERADGLPSNTLSQAEINAALPDIHDVFARIFQTDISTTRGYGEIDTKTRNAESTSWRTNLSGAIEGISVESYKESARYVGIDPALIDSFIEQFHRNLPYASEVRRLFHGDLGFDNLLIDNSKVSAVIDWAQMGYGDWMRDFARLNFWWQGRYGDTEEFAKKHDLEAEHIKERTALYHAVNALLTIDFSYQHKNDSTSEWLRDNVAEKLM